MKLNRVEVNELLYRRPGLNKIKFTAYYDEYTRRGTIVYDTLNGKFKSHNGDIELLAEVCLALRQPASISKG